MVEPVDPFEGSELDCLERAPWPAPADQLSLEQAKDGFGERIVVAVANAADRGFDAGRGEALGSGSRHTGWTQMVVAKLLRVAMTRRRLCSDRSGRAPLFSPGRLVVAGRDEQRRFWAAIAAGMASEIAAVAAALNSRPRKTLAWKTPATYDLHAPRVTRYHSTYGGLGDTLGCSVSSRGQLFLTIPLLVNRKNVMDGRVLSSLGLTSDELLSAKTDVTARVAAAS
jgi:hypothetical protein